MIGVVASIIDGVLVGAVYGLAAMGLTLIWGVMNVINLTHGAMIVLGMFALYFLASALGLPPYGAVPVTIVIGFVVGVLVYWIAVHRVIGRAHLMSLLSTFAMNMVLIGLGTALFSTSPYNVPVLATIGVNEAVKAFVSNFEPWGGATGIYLSLEVYEPLGGPRQALWTVYFLIVAVMTASLFLSYLIKRPSSGLDFSPSGKMRTPPPFSACTRRFTRRSPTAFLLSCRRSSAAYSSSRRGSSNRVERLI